MEDFLMDIFSIWKTLLIHRLVFNAIIWVLSCLLLVKIFLFIIFSNFLLLRKMTSYVGRQKEKNLK